MSTQSTPPLPLAGIRIIDLSRVVAGPFCTQVLGDLGAEVIRIEHPRERPAHDDGLLTKAEVMSWALNRNKRSVYCDLKSADGRDLVHRLAASSDVVFDNFRPGALSRLGLDHDTLTDAAGRHLITCSLTGFGKNGPLRDLPAYDPIVQAMSGLMHLTRANGSEGTPARWGVPIGDLLPGLFASIGVLAALVERDRSGLGQHVDVAMLDVMVALNTVRIPLAATFGQEPVATPHEGGQGTVPYGLFRCADGWISIGVMARAWDQACALIGRPDLVTDPRFTTLTDRQKNLVALVTEFQHALADLPAEKVEQEFLRHGIPAGRVLTVQQAVEHPQVAARSMTAELVDERGRRAVVAADPLGIADPTTWTPPSPFTGDPTDLLGPCPAVTAPAAGPPTAGEGLRPAPLDGVIVVEMDGDEPSKALAGQILADLGARVIRVDRPRPQQTDPYPDDARATAFRCALNRNKSSVSADLRDPDGQRFVRALVARADVVLDNYRPGVLDRLGLDHNSLTAIQPDVISCSVTGFGHTGPWGSFPAFDAAIQALGGGQSLSVAHDDPLTPVRSGSPIGGLTGALYATIGILASLRGRTHHGRGRRIDLSLLDAQIALLSYRIPQAVSLGLDVGPDPRVGGTGAVPYGVFPAAAGTWLVIGVTVQFWAPFCAAVGHPEWIADARFADLDARRTHLDDLHAVIEEALAVAAAADWQQRLSAAGVPVAAVATISEAVTSAQVAARGMRIHLPDPPDRDGVDVAGQPIRLSGCVPPVYRAAPHSGADTERIRAEFLAEL